MRFTPNPPVRAVAGKYDIKYEEGTDNLLLSYALMMSSVVEQYTDYRN